jgi:hypothetical protein
MDSSQGDVPAELGAWEIDAFHGGVRMLSRFRHGSAESGDVQDTAAGADQAAVS